MPSIVYLTERTGNIMRKTSYDLIILDIMIPQKDGLAVCKDLRIKKINTPILMLTAKDTVEDRVRGLDTGADDYLVKPFAFTELMARVRALLRRDGSSKSTMLSWGNWFSIQRPARSDGKMTSSI